ncbi:VWA domain-containing protein, partial [Candidatus Sumerlaeota bacterium]|nr:VWA domain-containing protein [Candidatus Sumerlaeota bacterium]
LGLARPVLLSHPLKKRNIALLLDRSASMKSIDKNGKSRLDSVKKQALDIISNLKKNDTLMLIAFDNSASVLQGFTNDKKLLKHRIDELKATDRTSRLNETLSIISSLYRKNPRLEVILFSDGRIDDLQDFKAPLPPINYVRIGESDFNVGFTQFSIRRNFESPLDFELFAQVKNFSDRKITSFVELFVDNVSVDIKEVKLAPQKTAPLIFNVSSEKQKKVMLKLDVKDALSVDNTLYGVLPEFHKTKILLVTSGNYFLQQALNTNPQYDVMVQKPEEKYDTTLYDVVIFDSCNPQVPPHTNAIYFNCQPPDGSVTFTGEHKDAFIIDTDTQHPIMNYTRLENIVIAKCKTMAISEGVKVLAETDQSPIIVLNESDSYKSLVIGFDIYDTDFPLKASFPIFLNNAVRFISGSYIDTEKVILTTRDAITVTAERPETTCSIKTPDNETYTLEFGDSLKTKFTNLKTVGLYELRRGDESTEYYGVNLLSTQESNIKPQDTIDLGRQGIISAGKIQQANIEIWRYFIWVALIVLIIEWLLYWRKMTI